MRGNRGPENTFAYSVVRVLAFKLLILVLFYFFTDAHPSSVVPRGR